MHHSCDDVLERSGKSRSDIQLAQAGWACALDRFLGWFIEVPLAILLSAEVAILFAGVIARYVFGHSLIWSDELAGVLFLWLSMLGAVSASRQLEHMRMSALVFISPKRIAQLLDDIAVMGSIIFLAAMLVPSFRYAQGQLIVTMPVLSISDAWRASALPVGIVLMLASHLLQIAKGASWRLVIPIGILAAVATGLWFLEASLQDAQELNLILFFVVLFIAAVFLSIPIAFSFGLVTTAYLTFTTYVPTSVVLGRLNEGMSAPLLLAVPLFIFLGLLVQMSGMASAMVNFLVSLLGHIKGGLSYALIAALYLVSGISGSKAADMAAVAPALFPEMKRNGSDPGRLVALLSATGAQTETVPPSIVLITIGSVANVSVAALFKGGLLPAAVLGIGLCFVVWRQSRQDTPASSSMQTIDFVRKTFLLALPALVLPVVIRLAVVEGVATATEVATIGIVYSVIVGIAFYRQLQWRHAFPMLVDAATLSGAILFVIGAASSMAWALTQSGFASMLADFMSHLPGGKIGFLVASAITFIIIGTVLEGIPAMVLFGPLLFPVARELGIHEVHYAMVVVISMGLGLFAPPFGVGYYIACSIGDVRPERGMRHMLPFILVLIIGLGVLIMIPWLSVGFL